MLFNNFIRCFLSVIYICFLIEHTIGSMALSLHLQNFDNAKVELRTALGMNLNKGVLSIITISRSPIDPIGTTELISHNEFEQILRLLYPLCTGKYAPVYREMSFPDIPFISVIPGVNNFRLWFWKDWWNNLRIPLNTAVSAQLFHRHQHVNDVSSFCQDFKYFYEQYLYNSCNIIVFNEMFFSQAVPLSSKQKDFINEKLLKLSKESKYSIIYPNFLYVENRSVSGSSIHTFLNTMESNYSNRTMNITNDPYCLQDCKNELLSHRNIQANANIYNQEFLINETYGINRGEVITKYKKATYWNESNNNIANGVLYDFGIGMDQTVIDTPISKALMSNISVEICFDLANAKRKNNNWNNGFGQSKLHIIQSNCIDPFNQTNINNLPIDVPIIYADSYIDYHRDGLPFCTQINLRERHGEYPYRLHEIRIGDSIYNIGIYLR